MVLISKCILLVPIICTLRQENHRVWMVLFKETKMVRKSVSLFSLLQSKSSLLKKLFKYSDSMFVVLIFYVLMGNLTSVTLTDGLLWRVIKNTMTTVRIFLRKWSSRNFYLYMSRKSAIFLSMETSTLIFKTSIALQNSNSRKVRCSSDQLSQSLGMAIEIQSRKWN